MNNFKFGRKSVLRLRTTNPIMQKLAHKALSICEVDFGIPKHGGKRTADEQSVLFDKGASKADGYSDLSYHQSGDALDVYAYVGKASWNPEELQKIVNAFKGAWATIPQYANDYELEFGIDWKKHPDDKYGWDAGHIQLRRKILT